MKPRLATDATAPCAGELADAATAAWMELGGKLWLRDRALFDRVLELVELVAGDDQERAEQAIVELTELAGEAVH